MNIIDALSDRQLLGASPAFRDLSTWSPWLTFLRAVYGLPLDAESAPLFCKATGRRRYDPAHGGWREVVLVCGRQSGKSRIAATLVTFEAAFAPREPDGSTTYGLLVAQDARAAQRVLFEYMVACNYELTSIGTNDIGHAVLDLLLEKPD